MSSSRERRRVTMPTTMASLALLLFTAHFPTASGDGLVASVKCESEVMVVALNTTSSLFGDPLPLGKTEYDVEIEDLDVNHTATCPKWRGHSDDIIPLKREDFTINYANCHLNFSKVYDEVNDVTTLFFNHRFVARSVSTTPPHKQIAHTADTAPFYLGCYYQVKGDVSTNTSVNGGGNDNGHGSVTASEDVDMWITDRKGVNITEAVSYGTPLTLHMALNSKGLEDYANFAPKTCSVAPTFTSDNPIIYVDSYKWQNDVFDALLPLQSISRHNVSTKNSTTGSGAHYVFTYTMNFTAFSFGGKGSKETLDFYCVFLMCVQGDSSYSCDRKGERVAKISTFKARRKREADASTLDGAADTTERERSKQAFVDVLPEDNSDSGSGGSVPPDWIWWLIWALVGLFILGLFLCCCCFAWQLLLGPMWSGRSRSHSHCHGGCAAPPPQPVIMPVPMAVPSTYAPSSVAYSLPPPTAAASNGGMSHDGSVTSYLRGLDAAKTESEFGGSRQSLVHSSSRASSAGLRRNY